MLLRIDLSFPFPELIDPALLPKLFPLANTNYLLMGIAIYYCPHQVHQGGRSRCPNLARCRRRKPRSLGASPHSHM